MRALPRIIADVEAGRFPAAQAGRYNMDFDAWRAAHSAADRRPEQEAGVGG